MSLSASVEIVFGLDRVLVKIEFRGGGWSGQIIAVGVGGDMYTTFQKLWVSKMH